MALRTMRAHKLKTAFSLIGVFVGVTFLIVVVSVIHGMNRYTATWSSGSPTFWSAPTPSSCAGRRAS
jgi:ABC-type lipoprotein release transport system permease subunit